MPIHSKRKPDSDRRRQDRVDFGGVDRRRCLNQRKNNTRVMTISDAEWEKYLDMPNLLEMLVEVPDGLQIRSNDIQGLFLKKRPVE